MKTAVISVLAVAAMFAAGCKNPYKGGKISEGIDAFVGLNVPLSDGVIQFELMNYLSGFRFAYDRDAEIECEYFTTNKTSFCGIYNNEVVKRFKVKMIPVERGGEDTNKVDSVKWGCGCGGLQMSKEEFEKLGSGTAYLL